MTAVPSQFGARLIIIGGESQVISFASCFPNSFACTPPSLQLLCSEIFTMKDIDDAKCNPWSEDMQLSCTPSPMLKQDWKSLKCFQESAIISFKNGTSIFSVYFLGFQLLECL